MTETIVFDKEISYTIITTAVGVQREDIMERAAKAIARELLSSGCLMHKAEYDINNQYTKEVVTLVVGRRKPRLPR